MLSVVNSVALGDSEIYIQSRLKEGIDVFDYSGNHIKKIAVDSYFGWTMKLYQNKLYYGTSDSSLEVYDLALSKVIHRIKSCWAGDVRPNLDGRYTMPTGLCIFNDLIYVVDSLDNSIIIMSLSGEFVSRVHLYSILELEARVVRIAVSEKYIVITCVEVDAVLLLDNDFNLLKSIIKTGSGPGEFEVPWDVALTDDRIYISDLYNHRIQVFNHSLSHIQNLGAWGKELGAFNYVYGMDINNQYALFADTWNHGFQLWKFDGMSYIPSIAVKDPDFSQVLRPSRVNIIDNKIAIADYLNHCFKFFDRDTLAYDHKLGSLGMDPGDFQYPVGIAKFENSFFCVDTRSGGITKFKNNRASVILEKTFLVSRSPDSKGFLNTDTNDSVLGIASDITNDNLGYLYIADMSKKSILKFSTDGRYIQSIGDGFIGVDNKTSFIGCEVYGDHLYVTSPACNAILIFDTAGKLINKVTNLGLNCPTGISINDKFIGIADRLNHRVLILDKDTFKVIKSIGGMGSDNGLFCAPWDLALFDDFIFVADSLNNRIQKIKIGDLHEKS